MWDYGDTEKLLKKLARIEVLIACLLFSFWIAMIFRVF